MELVDDPDDDLDGAERVDEPPSATRSRRALVVAGLVAAALVVTAVAIGATHDGRTAQPAGTTAAPTTAAPTRRPATTVPSSSTGAGPIASRPGPVLRAPVGADLVALVNAPTGVDLVRLDPRVEVEARVRVPLRADPVEVLATPGAAVVVDLRSATIVRRDGSIQELTAGVQPPVVLPAGDTSVWVYRPATTDNALVEVDLATGADGRIVALPAATKPVGVDTDHRIVLLGGDGTLYRFDADTAAAAGSRVSTVAAVGRTTIVEKACPDGQGCPYQQRDLATGATNPIFAPDLGSTIDGSPFRTPTTLSPDEQFLATYVSGAPGAPGAQVVVDLARGYPLVSTELSDGEAPRPASAWTPDSQWILQQDGDLGIVATSMPTPGMRTERLDVPGLLTFTVVAKV